MSLFGGTESNPTSGETPSDTFGDNEPTGLSDEGDSLADGMDDTATLPDANEGVDEIGNEAVRDPAPGVDPSNPGVS